MSPRISPGSRREIGLLLAETMEIARGERPPFTTPQPGDRDEALSDR